MVNKKFSTWPIKMTSVLGLAIGLEILNGNTGQITSSALDFNDIVYPIVAIGIAMIIVIWFMYQENRSYYP
jgi:hypothetical protein